MLNSTTSKSIIYRFIFMMCITAVFICSCSLISSRDDRGSHLRKLNNKHDSYIEHTLLELDVKNQDYIHIRLVPATAKLTQKVSYLIYLTNGKYVCQKITSLGVYEPDSIPLDFSKYMALIENKPEYDFYSDKSVISDSHYLYYSILVSRNGIKRFYRLLDDQQIGEDNVPGNQLLRQFILDTLWIEMRDSWVLDKEF